MAHINTVDRLREAGVFPTPQRIEVGDVIFRRPQHLSADQIIEELNEKGSRVSKATVYNTLNLFSEVGLVKAVNVDAARTYYDSTTASHHHFFNEDTGELTDIPAGEVEIHSLPKLPAGTERASVEVLIRVRSKDSA